MSKLPFVLVFPRGVMGGPAWLERENEEPLVSHEPFGWGEDGGVARRQEQGNEADVAEKAAERYAELDHNDRAVVAAKNEFFVHSDGEGEVVVVSKQEQKKTSKQRANLQIHVKNFYGHLCRQLYLEGKAEHHNDEQVAHIREHHMPRCRTLRALSGLAVDECPNCNEQPGGVYTEYPHAAWYCRRVIDDPAPYYIVGPNLHGSCCKKNGASRFTAVSDVGLTLFARAGRGVNVERANVGLGVLWKRMVLLVHAFTPQIGKFQLP